MKCGVFVHMYFRERLYGEPIYGNGLIGRIYSGTANEVSSGKELSFGIKSLESFTTATLPGI